ncbi:hypothetical protein BV898_08282 [Hypsibius exemplaris]|uniref:SAP domain-containing protein n=1 Tax=Hypsibius exemplaris TaxID=2072580 RepID=A0A1W0WR23_HYPEX|nr:hypothetical protein BV898_08282 [Hypsibius exemplaris]
MYTKQDLERLTDGQLAGILEAVHQSTLGEKPDMMARILHYLASLPINHDGRIVLAAAVKRALLSASAHTAGASSTPKSDQQEPSPNYSDDDDSPLDVEN